MPKDFPSDLGDESECLIWCGSALINNTLKNGTTPLIPEGRLKDLGGGVNRSN